MSQKVPIKISARHIHLSQKDLERLFGFGYKLKKLRGLSQPGLFAAKETVDIQKENQKIANVRIVGLVRNQTQVELSLTDAINFGIKIPIRRSGNLKNSPGITLIGPKGKINIKEGLIAAWRHIHFGPKEAKKLGLKDGDLVSIKTRGKRALIFNNVLVRIINKNFKAEVHLDTDEGNAAGIVRKGEGIILT